MTSETLRNIEDKMQKTIDGLKQDLATIRSGRASPALVEHLKVEYAGAMLPLNQVAGISVPEAKLLLIQPWDPGAIRGIEKAIQTSDLGLNPVSDGKIIRISLPPLSEERRQELIKLVRRRVEERKVVVRNLRREVTETLKESEKSKEITQDEHKRALSQLQKITDAFIATADKVGLDKEAELRQV
ncbi:MAG: ribosome recycling factor [Chloroflexi bacterium]|nr:ribosome recycling factor [Chloroflexota bacterium]